MTEELIQQLLNHNLSLIEAKVNQKQLLEIAQDYRRQYPSIDLSFCDDLMTSSGLHLVSFLQHKVNHGFNVIEQKKTSFTQFDELLERAPGVVELVKHKVDLALTLEYPANAIKAIRRGQDKWLDRHAFYERYQQIVAQWEKNIALYIERVGAILSRVLTDASLAFSGFEPVAENSGQL